MNSPLLTYDLHDDRVVAFSTTRQGGVSTGNYTSFNINRYCGDAAEAVQQNRRLLCERLGIAPDRLVMPHQTHGTVVRPIDEAFFSLRPDAQQQYLEGVDALMTDLPQVCIGVSTADCIPVLLYDPGHHAACAVHAGWRGTVGRIVVEAVAALTRAYGSRAQQLRAVIGPGISLDAFEVGDEVYQQFADAGFDMPSIARRDAKWHIDLWECNRQKLVSCGIPAANIHVAGVCTYTQPDRFFSARRLGISSGRIFSAILLHQTVRLKKESR